MREVILDTETTGLNPEADGKGDRLVEIGCLELVDGILSGQQYHQYINPQRLVPEKATEIHGLSDEFLADKPIFADIANEFLEFIGDAVLVIHNAEFDMGFINAELQHSGREPLLMSRCVDSLAMAREKFPNMRNSLDELCKRFEVDNSNRSLHGALLDAELLAQVYIRMHIGEQQGFGLEGSNSRMALQTAEKYDTTNRKGRVIAPTPEELSAHAKFIGTIENPLWRKRPSAKV